MPTSSFTKTFILSKEGAKIFAELLAKHSESVKTDRNLTTPKRILNSYENGKEILNKFTEEL